MMDVVAVIIVVLMFLIAIRCNDGLMHIFEEYIYEKYFLNKEKEDKSNGTKI